MQRFPDDYIDFVITSPPYNRKRNDKYKFYDDTRNDYKNFITSVIKELLRVTKETIFFNIQPSYYNREIVYELIGDFAKYIQNIIIWTKSNPLPSSKLSITNATEYIICLSKKPILKSIIPNVKNHIQTSVYSNPYTHLHKAVMHTEIVDYLLNSYIPKKSLVYDAFMGLGTTAERCLIYDARYIGSELIKEYCDFAEKRLATHQQQQKLF
jgi:DNA modification methylase